ncbi:MAG TPA: tetratricopeptide repeat protein [Bryobacteraceae bacterium]|nr:tetratricopeptide repeat protein [Bryobacteraceae bacterium]
MTGRIFSLAALFALCLSAEPKWVRLQAPGFEVYSSAGTRTGREVLRLLTRIRHVFAERTGQEDLSKIPVRVFVFRSDDDFRPYKVISGAAGYYQPGAKRDHIAMLAAGASFPRVVFHEYVHLMMRHAGVQAPVWLSEGTAEVYSTTVLHGAEVRIGDVVTGHLATLRSEPLLPMDVLLHVEHDSPQYNERDKTGIFYAQSWALAHMLNFAPSYQAGFPNLVAALEAGDDPARAFQRAFGKGLGAVRSDLEAYIRQARFTGVRFRASRMEEQPDDRPAQQLTAVEAGLGLHELLLAVGRTRFADDALQELAQRAPGHPGVQSALGDAALGARDLDRALSHYYEAMQLGDESGRLRYEYALVLREAGRHDTELLPWLIEALKRDPDLFDAHYLRGYLALEAGRNPEAAQSLTRASQLRPLHGPVWEHLALAHHRLGAKEQARSAAARARRLAARADEIARTEGLLRLIEGEADNIVRSRPLPPGNPAEHRARSTERQLVSGGLVQVDCLRDRARLHVITDSGKVLLLVREPGSVVLRNAGGTWDEFRCGEVPRRSVEIEYRPHADARYGTAGEVTAIEFR